MGTVVVKSNPFPVTDTVLKLKIRTIGSIPSTVDNFNPGIGSSNPERPSKTRTVMVGNKCRVCNIDIVSTIAAVPLKASLA